MPARLRRLVAGADVLLASGVGCGLGKSSGAAVSSVLILLATAAVAGAALDTGKSRLKEHWLL